MISGVASIGANQVTIFNGKGTLLIGIAVVEQSSKETINAINGIDVIGRAPALAT